MEQRSIGQLSVSVVGLGCNNFGRRLDAQGTAAVVHACHDAGIDFFDTSDMYGDGLSEEYLGKALEGQRANVTIATKFGAPNSADNGFKRGSPEWVREALDRSLARLGTDRIDLYQIHFPDPEVPIAETLGALHEAVQAGKVREIGCSNFGSGRLVEADHAAREADLSRFVSVQNRYSVLTRDPEAKVVPACKQLGVGLIPYFPLESGLLTGKYRQDTDLPEGTRLAAMPDDQRERFMSDPTLVKVERLRAHAESHGHTLLELAISWLASNAIVPSVIAGATKPEQVHANAAAASWQMSQAERSEIDALVC